MCVLVCVCVCPWKPGEVSDSLELEFQVVVRHLTGCWEPSAGALKEPQVLLPLSHPSSSSLFNCFYDRLDCF